MALNGNVNQLTRALLPAPNMNKVELAKFWWEQYPGIRERYSVCDMVKMLDLFNGQHSFKYKNSKIVAVLLYLMVNNEYCDKIEANASSLSNPEFLMECLNNKGPHCHFIGAIGDGAGNILWCLKEVIKREKPESVGWYKTDMNKLHWIKRRTVWPSQQS